MLEGLGADLDGVASGDGEDRHGNLLAEHLELLEGAGACDVGGDQEHLAVVFRLEEARQLGGAGGLTGALKAHHHDAGDPLVREGDGLAFEGHHGLEFVLTDLYELFDGADGDLAARDFGGALDGVTDGLRLHPLEEALGDGELNVRLQEGKAHVTEGGLDIFFG